MSISPDKESKATSIWWKPVEGLEMDSQRAIDLINGKVKPASSLEYVFIQDNANTMLPIDESQPTPRVPYKPKDFVPPTFAAKVSEALDAKADRGEQ